MGLKIDCCTKKDCKTISTLSTPAWCFFGVAETEADRAGTLTAAYEAWWEMSIP